MLLDDALSASTTLLSDLAQVDLITLATIDESLRAGWAKGWHCFAWLPYDLGEAHLGIRAAAPGALYWFAGRAAATPPDPGPAWLADAAHDVTEAHFAGRVAQIHEAIAAGTSYQVNYTHRITGRLVGDATALYGRLRQRQAVAFGALAHLPGPAAPWTLSLSPELFLRVDGDLATARPMKGTAPLGTDPGELSSDPKNRAENLMIIDLLRNDLSRIATPGTVEVPSLFDVEAVGQLWQMTSTVTARLPPGTTPGRLLAAAFPCGSITGAPKLASMALIRDTEQAPRGLYTGSIGLIEPADGPLGWSMTLSIAIRTAEIDAAGNVRMGVGSGIVADSTARAEWDECRIKAGFLTSLRSTVTLKEAMRVIDGAAPLAARHQARLEASARELGFPEPKGVIARAVAGTAAGGWRVGVEYDADGSASIARTPLQAPPRVAEALLAPAPWPAAPLARHKSSDRAHLDEAWRDAVTAGAFDTIGYDAHGRVLEGGRSTVFALLDDGWVTPTLGLGVLPGVQRAAVLADPTLIGAATIEEAEFTVEQLRQARRLVLTNAVYGALPARLRPGP